MFETSPPSWLWRGTLLTLTLALAAGASLAAAVAGGWNNPRPAAPPDSRWSGPMVLQVEAGEQSVLVLCDAGEAFAFEATATPLTGADLESYGLLLDRRDDGYTLFAIDTTGYMAVLRVEGERESALVEWQQFPHIRRGQAANRLRLACAGGVCHGWINDEHAVAFERGGEGGTASLWGRAAGRPARFVFQDVAVFCSFDKSPELR